MTKEELKIKIDQIAEQIHHEVILDRRHLHSNPELSFHEFETRDYIASRLSDMGIEFQKMANTGLVALIKGDLPSRKVMALRADIDALPISEANDVSYKSKKAGIMHACGHDAHTSSLLGTAKILLELKKEFGGTVKLIFQPSEEKYPGGANKMIREGVLENPKPAAVIGQHVMPELETGKVGFRTGKYMASNDELYVTIRGKGGHGAQPHQNIDPVVIAAHIIIALQQIVSRMANPNCPSVLSFGKVIANGAVNVIPDEVYMEGTFRTMNESWRKKAHQKMKQIAQGIAKCMNANCTFEILKGYPFLINEERLTGELQKFAIEYLGKENVVDLDIWMAAEDFAYYSQISDSCFYRLGTGNPQEDITSSLHTPTFNIDENSLTLSTGLMAYLALRQLGN
ncbi:MAG TPA: M20 family metallopeptidase [Hanamia sp.]|nr:M20 family metallopeptidase [Hanamia sp.]